ncbi:MAG: response regulator [Reyranella sp.]|uniref:MHYT domain-containing protein n=1 Tax=Reyranella sp. TaxID=1929291 RepID=UPI001AC023E7|nr:MHYT domain-containing protein [Reyranella sp.]MBN9089888.1 response regulator [Reyranella sp.]
MTLSQFFAFGVDPSQAIPGSYNYALVLLSYLVAALGSYAFLQFATRIAELRDAGLRLGWLAIGAIAMGGGIWAMHFIGMLAHILPIPVSYDPGITALSIVPAILAAAIALHVVARPVVTTPRLLIGGTLMGAGIGAMHYTGMSALQLDALVRYDPTLFAASIGVAVLLAILALQTREWISRVRPAQLGGQREVVGALILGFAVTAMHYTAMASTYCFAADGQRVGVTDIDEAAFAAVIALIASLVLLLALVAVIFDRRVAQEARMRAEAMDSHRRTREQLFQAQKMEAVGQLTGGVAHDFNNILTIVLANADAILEDETVSPRIAKRAQQICDAGQKATELTRQLLAFSRKQILKPEKSDLGDIVAATGQLLRRTLGEHVVVQTAGAAQLWTVNVDRTQVETSLINLCINARDAMPTGGRITIETGNVTLDRDYVESQEDEIAAGDYVLLSVTDTGTGMPPEVAKRAFEPFFTTKPPGKGSGLGLSMVYGFIRQSNGHIEIYSEAGQGTTVKMYFPRSDQRSSAIAPVRREAPPGGSERILVVEDEDAVRVIVGEQLEALGYDVHLAGGAEQALALLRSERFDLVLTDVVMPGRLNGKGLADEIVRSWPGTRVVFMSGYSENALLNDGRLDSGVMLLAKPHQKADLARIVRSALSRGGGQAVGDAALQG